MAQIDYQVSYGIVHTDAIEDYTYRANAFPRPLLFALESEGRV